MITDQAELENLATNLRLQMGEKKWSQLDLSSASSVPHYTISRILHAKCDPSLSAVSRLAKALNAKIDNLIKTPPRKKMRNAS